MTRSRTLRRGRLLSLLLAVGALATLALAGPAQAATTTFDRTWGKGVNGGTAFGICTVAANCMIGTSGGLGGEMNFPQADATDSSGNVYVAEEGGRRVSKFDSSGNFLRAWGKGVNGGTTFGICTVAANCQPGQSGSLGGDMNFIFGIATDSSDNVYVTDVTIGRVSKFDSSGNFLRTWGIDVVLSGEHNTGTGFEICVNPAGSSPDDVCQGSGGGDKGGSMSSPWGIATDPSDNVYVADSGFDRVQKFDSSGNWQRAWGKGVNGGTVFGICTVAANCQSGDDGFLGGEMTAVSGIATDSSANVYISDGWNRIQKYDSSGNWLRAWGKGANGGTAFGICTVAANCNKTAMTGGLGGEMDSPFGVHVNSSNTVLVPDTYNSRIQEFDTSGAFQRTWGRGVNGGGTQFEICTVAANCKEGLSFGSGSGCEFDHPYDLASDSGGGLYVADANIYRIEKYVPDPQVPPEESVCTASPPPFVPPTVPGTTPTPPTTPAQTQAETKKKKKKKKKKHQRHKTQKIEPQFTG